MNPETVAYLRIMVRVARGYEQYYPTGTIMNMYWRGAAIAYENALLFAGEDIYA